jgi:hypothetical protein
MISASIENEQRDLGFPLPEVQEQLRGAQALALELLLPPITDVTRRCGMDQNAWEHLAFSRSEY